MPNVIDANSPEMDGGVPVGTTMKPGQLWDPETKTFRPVDEKDFVSNDQADAGALTGIPISQPPPPPAAGDQADAGVIGQQDAGIPISQPGEQQFDGPTKDWQPLPMSQPPPPAATSEFQGLPPPEEAARDLMGGGNVAQGLEDIEASGEALKQATKFAADADAAILLEESERDKKLAELAEQDKKQKVDDDSWLRAQKDYRDQRLYANMEKIKDAKVDPGRYFKNLSTGGKVATTISLILSGIGNALAGVENSALKLLDKHIDEDINLQLKEIQKLKDDAELENNVLGQMIADTGDINAAYWKTRELAYELVKKQAESEIKKFKSYRAKQNGEAAVAEIDLKIGQSRMRYNEIMDENDAKKLQALIEERRREEATQQWSSEKKNLEKVIKDAKVDTKLATKARDELAIAENGRESIKGIEELAKELDTQSGLTMKKVVERFPHIGERWAKFKGNPVRTLLIVYPGFKAMFGVLHGPERQMLLSIQFSDADTAEVAAEKMRQIIEIVKTGVRTNSGNFKGLTGRLPEGYEYDEEDSETLERPKEIKRAR
jgi:hypothetical protein